MNAPIPAGRIRVGFDTRPERYNHWKLGFEGPLATLTLDVAEDKGIAPGYKLKLNSYDLGVDIELHDALNRIRFEHPEVKCVVLTSGKSRMFCSGANIYMLGLSPHSWKVNFCKFTNETRNGIEDSSANSGLKFLAALNGTTAGGGYEVALACDEIALVDDRSTTVSLPEVPLLGVLPGTGGLTRLVDKRKVRRDLADVFCTTAEGVRADRAKGWKLVDHVAKPQQFAEMVKARALELAKLSDRPGGQGVELKALARREDDSGLHYSCVEVHLNRSARTATLTVTAPEGAQPQTPEQMLAAGADWWPLKVARELDDAILNLRHNELEIGLWLLKTRGSAEAMLALDAALEANAKHWFVRETIGYLRRTLARLDVSSRSMFAIVDQGSCFAGTLAELLFAADRAYMLHLPEEEAGAPHLVLSKANFGLWPMASGAARIEARFCEVPEPVEAARQAIGEKLDAHDALELGLVTAAPDDLDWEDEIRLAIEERASLSPDALTGMEASLRFSGRENMATRIFGRLTAWQNWIFIRPNAVGEQGALKVYGSGAKPKFNWERV
jgi:benzoyl-CoA-dihydrodiol lyase